jgi:Parvulin-like peptidyl-prolyl isomerase
MLADIRKYANSLVVKILFVLLMLSFVIWGVADSLRPRQSGGWVAKVGDQEISRIAFENELRATVRQLQQSFGGQLDETMIKSLGISRSVLNQMVNRALVETEAADLGIRASDDLLRRALIEDQRFRTPAGQFDNAAFQAFVQRLGRSQDAFFNDLRRELSARTLVATVEVGAVVPADQLRMIERYFAEQRVIEAVAIKFEDAKVDAAPDDAALESFYAAHTNDYRRPEFRKVTAVVIGSGDLAGRIKVDDAEIKSAYEERISEFVKPEQRTFRQMLFNDEAKARWAAQQLKAGRSWDDVADAPEAGSPAVATLGPIGRSALPEELRAAVFDVAKGASPEPVQSSLGWHVIDVVSVQEGTTAPLSEVSERLSRQLVQEKAADQMIDLGNRLEEVLGQGKSLEAAAEELGLSVRTIDAVDAKGSDRAGTMLQDLPPRFVQTAFGSPKGIPGSLVEADRDTLFVLRVDDIQPPEVRPFADVREAVAAAWRRDQQMSKAQAMAQEIIDRGKKGTLAAAATGFGLTPVTVASVSRLGMPSEKILPAPVIRQAMEAPAGRLLSIPTDDAIFVAVSRPQSDGKGGASDAVIEEERDKAREMLRNDVLVQYLDALRGRYPVRVNQAVLDELGRQVR